MKKALIISFLLVGAESSFALPQVTNPSSVDGQAGANSLPTIPTELPPPNQDGVFILPLGGNQTSELTLDGKMQNYLQDYLHTRGNPVAAVVVADVATGHILAMAQGKRPEEWGGDSHTALYSGFPAASLFKTVAATAAFETGVLAEDLPVGLTGGCSHVLASGIWLQDDPADAEDGMTLRRAFGRSCNGFFAKIAINHLGLGVITNFARRLGWGGNMRSDFYIKTSPMRAPTPETSSAHTVGSFAAGFGQVGLSAIHAAWIALAIANDGLAKPITIFKNSGLSGKTSFTERLFSADAAAKLRSVMEATVHGGTATFAFRNARYRDIQPLVGGKTGTLSGNAPKGIATWFTGMMPLDHPQVVVAAVVILEDKWLIKGPGLAAEAFWSYENIRDDSTTKVTGAPAANPAVAVKTPAH